MRQFFDNSKFTPESTRKMVEMVKARVPIKVIAQELKLKPKTITNKLHSLGQSYKGLMGDL